MGKCSISGTLNQNMYIRISVIAGAKREVVKETAADHWDISVKEPAEQNLANRRVLELVRVKYPNMAVRQVSGHHSPSKIVSVDEKESS